MNNKIFAIIIIFLTISGVLIVYSILKMRDDDPYNKLCKSQGFNKMTDRKDFLSFDVRLAYDKIECDHKYICNVGYPKKENKWGEVSFDFEKPYLNGCTKIE